jgi:large subunit GTPase 1
MNAAALQQARRDAAEALNRTEAEQEVLESDEAENDAHLDSADNGSENDTDGDDMYFSAEEEDMDTQDPRARIVSVQELEGLFLKMSPNLSGGFYWSHLSNRSSLPRFF